MNRTEADLRRELQVIAQEAPAFTGWRAGGSTQGGAAADPPPSAGTDSTPGVLEPVAPVAEKRGRVRSLGLLLAVAASLLLAVAVAVGAGWDARPSSPAVPGPSPLRTGAPSAPAPTSLEGHRWVLAVQRLGDVDPPQILPGDRPQFRIRDGSLLVSGLVNSAFGPVRLDGSRIIPTGPMAFGAAGCGGDGAPCAQDNRIGDFFAAGPTYVLRDGWVELSQGGTRIAFVPVDSWPAPTPNPPSGAALDGRWTLAPRDVDGIPLAPHDVARPPTLRIDGRRAVVSSGCNTSIYDLSFDGRRLTLTRGKDWSRTEIGCVGETLARPSIWTFFEAGPEVRLHDGWLEISGPAGRFAFIKDHDPGDAPRRAQLWATTELAGRHWVAASSPRGGIAPRSWASTGRKFFTLTEGAVVVGPGCGGWRGRAAVQGGRIVVTQQQRATRSGYCPADASSDALYRLFASSPRFVLHDGWVELEGGGERMAFADAGP